MRVRGFVGIIFFMSDFSSCVGVDGWEGSGEGVCWVEGGSGSFRVGLLGNWVARCVWVVVSSCNMEDSCKALILRNCCSRGDWFCFVCWSEVL